MTEPPRRIHLEALNIRLTGHDAETAAALARDLPAALARQFDGAGAQTPKNPAEEIAQQVAQELRGHMGGEG
jgi:hypothetical protein